MFLNPPLVVTVVTSPVCLCSHWSFSRAELATPSGDVLRPAATGSPAVEMRSASPTREETCLCSPRVKEEEARRREEEERFSNRKVKETR